MPPHATAAAAMRGCVWYLVVDPHRYFVHAPDTQCMVSSQVPVHGRFTLRDDDTLESIVRQQLSGVRSSDAVLPDGYPKADPKTISVVRNGSSIAIVGFHPLARNEWEWQDLETCDDAHLTWTAPS
jgi:hypothetical protein